MSGQSRQDDPVTLAIDAHVHLHDPRRMVATLDHARTALCAVTGTDGIGVLLLAERQGTDLFGDLQAILPGSGEPEALWRDEARSLLVVAGRQIVSAESLEILGLATRRKPEDGRPAVEIVSALLDDGAVVVLPWGVGKWLGARGRLVDHLLARFGREQVFLGDNGGRPWFWPMSRRRGARILAGSDPLPLPGAERAIGRYGFILRTPFDRDRPAASLRGALRSPLAVEPFGRQRRLPGFLAEQAQLRIGA
jgi:hypothetical protein